MSFCIDVTYKSLRPLIQEEQISASKHLSQLAEIVIHLRSRHSYFTVNIHVV